MEQRIIDLAKKLYALHQQGVGGEKINATQKLEQLMKRYGISWETLDDEVPSEQEITVPKDQVQLFFQIVANVAGRKTEYSEYVKAPRGKRRFDIIVTVAQFVEIRAKLDFYWEKYQQELQLFTSAFIHKNRLFAKAEANDDEDEAEISLEEKQRLFKIRQMMDGMDKHEFQKRIEK